MAIVRADAGDIFRNEPAIDRLVAESLIEKSDERALQRHRMTPKAVIKPGSNPNVRRIGLAGNPAYRSP